MSTTIKVNCKDKEIVLTWHVWLSSDRFDDKDVQTIKDVVADKWNNPKSPLKYGECTLKVEFDINRDRTKPKPPPRYDDWTVAPGGTTIPADPSKSNMTSVDREKGAALEPPLDPRKISHELGHCFGINDPAGHGHKLGDWDKKGIKPEHVEEIIKAFAKANDGKWPIGEDPKCCNPKEERKREKIVIKGPGE